MKITLRLLAIIASISLPSTLLAQKSAPEFIPFSPAEQPILMFSKPDLQLTAQTSTEGGTQLLFMNHLPSTLPREKTTHLTLSQTDAVYHYNMPVVKPGKTSNIPTAKLDPNSPYTYNMPIRKSGKRE